MRRALPPFLTLLFIAVGCSDGTGPGPVHMCTERPTITVSGTSTAPAIDWSPACAVTSLVVGPLVSGFAASANWSIAARDTFRIVPPVRYGVAPAHAVEFATARPLGRDTTFIVSVSTSSLGGVIYPGISAQSIPFTACVGASVGPCPVTREVMRDLSASGIRISAALDRTTITRGDTATATITFTNSGAQSASLFPASSCGNARAESSLDGRPSIIFPYYCNGPLVGELTIPAGASVTQTYKTAAVEYRPDGVPVCPPIGTYEVRFVTMEWVGGLRVGTPPVRFTVRESSTLRSTCDFVR